MFCPHCGLENPNYARFCRRCGYAFLEKSTPDSLEINRSTVSDNNPSVKKHSPVLVILLILLCCLLITALIFICIELGVFSNLTSNHSGESKIAEEENESMEPFEDETEASSSDIKQESETTKVPEYKHYYSIIISDCTWEEARDACIAENGHLVTINSEDEYTEICEMLTDTDIHYVWIGGISDTTQPNWEENCWITGEPMTFSRWYPDEPSGQDLDGTPEHYLCLWDAKYEETKELGWTMNDQRNNLIGDFPNLSGKLAYICEYETEVKE